jgi:hypothetical protein
VVSIYEVIRREMNPFDSTTFRPGNFWQEQQDPSLTVDSIHQDLVRDIEAILDQVAADNRTRTLLLAGDSGAGKSYLLGRLKKLFNSRAFFAYIGPWPDSDYIWRHALRNTVDSLMYVPEWQQESQLLLWLKSLARFENKGLMEQLWGERNLFVHNCKKAFPRGIYNASEFFGVLYDLMNPEVYPLACEWLKGDDLDEDTLKTLQVKRSIDSEETARKILSNFGIISAATQPIVLCFDNLDNIDRALDGFINLQALFNVNSIIHNQKLKNFFVIISIVTNTWKQNSKRIQPADLARLDMQIRLQPISLDQAEALWASRLFPLHRQAQKSLVSNVFPLNRQQLEEKFPGGKTRPRYVLMLGRQLFQDLKNGGIDGLIEAQNNATIGTPDSLAAFQLLWLKEFNKMQEKVTRFRYFSAPELMQMLREALNALQVAGIQPKLLPSPSYASYSLSYHLPVQLGRVGVVWTEEPNLNSFCHLMKACEKTVKRNLCQTLILIRAEWVGNSGNQGYRIYRGIFSGNRHKHLIPDLVSLHYLATYHSLVNAACAGELVIGDLTPSLADLEGFVRKSKVFEGCLLLRALGVFDGVMPVGISRQRTIDFSGRNLTEGFGEVKEFLLNLMKTQQMMGRQVLIENAVSQFPLVEGFEVSRLIDRLCEEGLIFVLDPGVSIQAQLVCLVRK